MKVLVTGGAGYIGSHACKALAQSGHQPVAYDNLCNGHRTAVRWGPLHEGDILDSARLADAFAIHKPDAVMHFAALAYVEESFARPDAYYRTNVSGTLCLLDAMRHSGVSRIVFSSSCATYGVVHTGLATEATPQLPINPYGRTKLVGEQMLFDHSQAHGIGAIALRYFNAAGADSGGEIGEMHEPEPHLIPIVLRTALGLRDAITINGDDFDTPDGTCIRDYLHVEDIAAAHVLALNRIQHGKFDAFNLGVGRGVSVREVVEAAQRVALRPIPVRVGPRRLGDPARLIADPTKASTQLDWRARVTDIEPMIESAWRWMQRSR
jgi:UDP-arabinose 4-epimerase